MASKNKLHLAEQIKRKLRLHFGCSVEDATESYLFKACALVLRDIMSERQLTTDQKTEQLEKREVHYLSMEFLVGRSLLKNAYNLGLIEDMKSACKELGYNFIDLCEMEPDAGLGNGGLGRLAACYLDSLTTLEIPACGYSICYELGIFKQKIINGQQVELADDWMGLGEVWLIPKVEEAVEVRFGGKIRGEWEDGKYVIQYKDYQTVLAIPKDMEISGFQTEHTNLLRLWDAKSPVPVDMALYSSGDYLKAVEQQAMAEVIAKVLYPADDHYEGKSLRLKQQYFFVSATIQSIVREHRKRYGTLANFHRKHVIQINDTHPTLAIPELMRILLDEEGYTWQEAWGIVTQTFAYTNHTVLSEALERWNQDLISTLLPRIWMIIQEISSRYESELSAVSNGNLNYVARQAIIWGGEVRMANLCTHACFAVNGVSALHSQILKDDVFRETYERMLCT